MADSLPELLICIFGARVSSNNETFWEQAMTVELKNCWERLFVRQISRGTCANVGLTAELSHPLETARTGNNHREHRVFLVQ